MSYRLIGIGKKRANIFHLHVEAAKKRDERKARKKMEKERERQDEKGTKGRNGGGEKK